jgi:hypothetical protein
MIYAALDDATQAMAWLEQAYDERFNRGVLLLPGFDPVRSDPPFESLERRVGSAATPLRRPDVRLHRRAFIPPPSPASSRRRGRNIHAAREVCIDEDQTHKTPNNRQRGNEHACIWNGRRRPCARRRYLGLRRKWVCQRKQRGPGGSGRDGAAEQLWRSDHRRRRHQRRTVVLTEPGEPDGGPDGRLAQRRRLTHHVVFDDGSVDTGNLDPGASSQPQAIGTAGGAYHCSIHPVMVGSVNQDTAPPPVCQGGYCN